MPNYRYGRYIYGPDPLALPFDVRGAVDEMGEAILAGADPADALRELLRRGLGDQAGRRGLDELLRRARERQREVRGSGRLDGILEQARALLDTAVGQERAELFPDPGDEARLREADLDALPADTAQAIRQLADYDWRSPAARQTFDQLRQLLRSEVLDSQFRGMRRVMSNPDPEAMQRVKDMLADLNQMLAADARGEHTQADFDQFMARHGDLFPEQPQNLEELVDSLVRRMAAAERLLRSLSDEQREELAGLMASALDDAGLAAEMARLADALRARRPDLDRAGMSGGVQMSGEEPLGLGDATTALAELADLAELETALGQDYPGASLDDIDEEAVRRAFGRQAVDDVEALRRIERELERQGYLTRNAGQLELTPKAVRRLGDTALRRIFADLSFGRSGDHDLRDAGQAGELTGTTRAWEFGDEQPLDVPTTVRNALLRTARTGGLPPAGGAEGVWGAVSPQERGDPGGSPPRGNTSPPASSSGLRGGGDRAPQRRGRVPACRPVLLDAAARDLGGGQADGARAARAAAQQVPPGCRPGRRLLQLRTRTARDRARRARLGYGAGHQPASRADAGRPPYRPAPGTRAGRPDRDRWRAYGPPAARRALLVRLAAVPETVELTLAEVDKMTRRHAALNIFMLADDARLSAFVDNVARRNGGRVLQAAPEHLGEYVIRDFLRTRGAGRR